MIKAEIRNILLEKRMGLSKNFVRTASGKIAKKLLNSEIIKNVSNILIYLPINGEVNTLEILNVLRERQINISVPAYMVREWVICKYHEGEKLEKLFHGVPQPKKILQVNVSSLDLIIMPGVAFAKNGARIGMGLAVYDRLLQDSRATRVGLAYEFQIVDKIDTDEYDLPVDYIVTEKQILKIT